LQCDTGFYYLVEGNNKISNAKLCSQGAIEEWNTALYAGAVGWSWDSNLKVTG